MDKVNLNKIKFKKTVETIEIFSPQKFKDYYLRGQIIEFSGNIYDKLPPDEHARVYYHLKVIALINDNYIESISKKDAYDFSWGVFFGRTKREFKEIKLAAAKKTAESIKIPLDQLLKTTPLNKNELLEIELREFGIQENSYILNSIRNKKNVIVLKIELTLDRVEYLKDNSIIPDYPKRIYILPAYQLAANSQYGDDDDVYCFEELFDMLYFEFDYNFTDKNEYFRLLTEVGELGYEWIEKQITTQKYIAKLNIFNLATKDRSLPFYDFCYKFFDSLLDELKDRQKITQCSFCGNIFLFHQTRKYCSLKTEGKNCGKSARNQRFYLRHRDEILPKARITTRELRTLYKERGVKK